MKQRWLERMLDVVADRGRELLKLESGSRAAQDPAGLCRQLLDGHGEASALALAREILLLYKDFDAEQREAFFEMLLNDFGPDVERIQTAVEKFARTRGVDDFLRLSALVEPPRQELFRRLNMAPSGTASLVAMRADLLALQRKRPEMRAVDADLKHLLSSWFNRGFLQLRVIDWGSPAEVLEKLFSYESVHEIQGWDDLRRRMMADRRCFAFFHPAMPDEPLIFVEVALVKGMSDRVQPLLEPEAPLLDPDKADTAMFYSINNTQMGLRGISFGNFLIKQVLTELRAALPGIRHFATLSPLPRFAATLSAALAGSDEGLSPALLEALLEEHGEALCARAGAERPLQALALLLENRPVEHADVLGEPLSRLALAYLTRRRSNGALLDPVAAFHLSNGARLERINPFADLSGHGMAGSFGVMVNYLYLPEEVEANHERFVGAGEIVMARSLARLHRRIEEARTAVDAV
ncbi:MAG: malonyl-CoA decarboxylase [Gammaproteobacteria bacterium]